MPIVDSSGAPNGQMMQFWQQFANQITKNITAAANAQSSANGALSTAQNAQTTANSKLDKATADGLYVHQDATPAWQTPSGTSARATFAAYSAPTISNPPTQAQVQAVADALQTVSQHLVALITDLRASNTLT
jgi:K+-transporting ATPase c subunit